MKLFAIGLAAVLLAAGLSPVAASAANKPAKPSAADAADAKKHDQGMTEAPPLVQQIGLPCTVTDATYFGEGKAKDKAGKEQVTKYYEVACQEGIGYIVGSSVGAGPTSFDCLVMSQNKPKPGEADKGSLYCRLKANLDPPKSFAPVLAKGGATNCTPSQARYVGSTADLKLDQYEVGCSEGSSYIVDYPHPGSTHQLHVADCMMSDAGTCQYFGKDQIVARLTGIAGSAKRSCPISNGRYVGTSASNKHVFYEIACGDQPGFVLEVDGDGKYVANVDCARAAGIGGGCTLTSASAAQTQEISTYTGLAKQIGYPCAVKAYHSYGPQDAFGKRETVELACSDHPEGGIVLLPIDAGQKGDYFNCVRAENRTLKCALTPPEPTYAKISAEVAAIGHTCQVTNARGVGLTPEGDDYIEVACAGQPGQMLEYGPGIPEKIKTLLICSQATGIGTGCKLSK